MPDPTNPSHRERVTLQCSHPAQEEVEILAISAGSGNGWEFPADVLRESMPLWDGVECFIDHAWESRSLRDLAGVCHDPRWSESSQGVQLSLRPFGPAAEILRQSSTEMHQGSAPLPNIGFSADLVFSAAGRQVTRIEKVLSVDLVVRPARGGVFLPESEPVAQKISLQEKRMEKEEIKVNTSKSESPAQAIDQAEPDSGIQSQMCASLLEASLIAAHLPPSAECSL